MIPNIDSKNGGSKLKVELECADDFDWETAKVIREDGSVVAEVTTVADCPEDNNISRLGVVEAFEAIIKELEKS